MGASNATSLKLDANDFIAGTEELGLQKILCRVDIVQKVTKWQVNREMRIQSLGNNCNCLFLQDFGDYRQGAEDSTLDPNLQMYL